MKWVKWLNWLKWLKGLKWQKWLNPSGSEGRWKGLIIKVPSIIALAPFENHKGYIKKKSSFQKKVAQNIFIQKWSTRKVIKVKVLFFLLYLLWFTNGTGGYYTWNLDDQALSPPLGDKCEKLRWDQKGYMKKHFLLNRNCIEFRHHFQKDQLKLTLSFQNFKFMLALTQRAYKIFMNFFEYVHWNMKIQILTDTL